MPHQVGPLVGEGVLQGVADPRLGRQMHHPPRAAVPHQGLEGVGVRHVHPLQPEARAIQQRLDPRLLQGRVVVGIEVVDPDDLLATVQQPQGHEPADEPRRAGDDDQDRLIWRWSPGCEVRRSSVFPAWAHKSNPGAHHLLFMHGARLYR